MFRCWEISILATGTLLLFRHRRYIAVLSEPLLAVVRKALPPALNTRSPLQFAEETLGWCFTPTRVFMLPYSQRS